MQTVDVMDSLRAGYGRLRRGAERMVQASERVGKQAFHSQVVNKVMAGRQHSIGDRIVVEDRQLSEGGFAFVWVVRDMSTQAEMAIKKIICQDAKGLAMARREVEILEQLPPHPNLVRYYGHAVQNEGRAKEVVLLFELCTGGHLLDLLNRCEGALTEERIVAVFKDVCKAVALLHSFSPPIQHRDLKVENVLLGSNGCFKLCDFGSWSCERCTPSMLDKTARAQLQEQIDRYTTMMYRPPEMVDFFLEFPISEKVDIWMLGCILFTLMFYRHPFQDESSLAIANARYHMPSSPEHSERMRDLTHWLLARDPADRPSAQVLLGLLERWSEGLTLSLPDSVIEKKNHARRLYGVESTPTRRPEVRQSAGSPSSSGSRDKSLRASSEERTRRVKDKKSSRRSQAEGDPPMSCSPSDTSFWGQAELISPDAWPTTSTVPAPSQSWATFDAGTQSAPVGPAKAREEVSPGQRSRSSHKGHRRKGSESSANSGAPAGASFTSAPATSSFGSAISGDHVNESGWAAAPPPGAPWGPWEAPATSADPWGQWPLDGRQTESLPVSRGWA